MDSPTLPFKEPDSLAGRLAEYFKARPNRWIDARDLFPVAGSMGWRSRISDVRRAPFFLNIRNRQRRVRVETPPPAHSITISEYAWLRQDAQQAMQEGEEASVSPLAPSV